MCNEPLVSIVIATFRRDKSLLKSIRSVLEQTYKNIEIVVVDDNADEYWNCTVKNICEEFNGIIYIRNTDNCGSAITRNIGIEACNGEYVTFLDDDDLYLPEKIEHQIKGMLIKNSDFSITDLKLYNYSDDLVDFREHKYIVSHSNADLIKYHLKYHLTGTDTFMFKRTYLIDIGMFPSIDIGDEFYLMLNAIESGGRFSYIKGCYVKAYVHFGENEGLSSGSRKIEGEKKLFSFKKTKFSSLKNADIKYIKMRHHAVLAYAYYRSNSYSDFLKEILLSALSSPLGFLKLVVEKK
ncbi:glycosyltransferase family 2 protein [Vibrio vulnificus]|uniref:glycosyltransferase family 2 protein n=1 Tax=Vibrio vulnificus TaxID=672 RepID=UPI0028941D2F|nr:glycosyltransferase family 2 protein [Vibrio vulnificus]ELH9600699.1 glycosyltransferase family 2 protein [Vibrio vulnificus]ELH9615157.1 glycosyltransferase family 2 protein [Vibrio vulnificus]